MTKLSNLTVKGQVTIPKDVRDALGLIAGEPVEFAWNDRGEAVIRKPCRDPEREIEAIKRRIESASERFAHLRTGRRTEDIMRDIRGDDPFPP